MTDAKGQILGATIVGEHAGEVIQMWSLAISQGLNIKAMTQWISPYPTSSEINKRVAYGYYATAAASPLVRKWSLREASAEAGFTRATATVVFPCTCRGANVLSLMRDI